MHGKKIILGTISCLWLHVPAFGCGGAAIGAAGNSSPAQVSVAPAKAGSPIYDRISEMVTAAVLTILDLPIIPMDPLTGTVAGTALNPENAANIDAALQAKSREGRTGTSNVNAARALQQIEAEEKAQFSKPP